MIERSVYMSIWDDYKTSVRTRINVKQDRLLLTERQWKLKHYVKLNDKCGKYLWVNAYCPNQELYLWDEEVRKMTDEELVTYRAEEKEKRVARAKRRELKAEFDKLKKQKLDKSSIERRSFNMIKAMRNKIINNSVCIAKTVNIALYDYKENFVADFITDFGIRKTIKMSKKNLQKMFNWKEAVEFLKFINYDKDMYEKFIRYFFPDKLEYLSLVKENEVIVVDTETTGLNPETDELLQVSIIDGDGNTLFNSYLKPVNTNSWDEAMAVNNITPKMVEKAPTSAEIYPALVHIIESAKVIIGYNVNFDLKFLSANAVGAENKNATVIDVMQDFADIYGEWSDKYGCNKWQKLTKCAEYYGYDWENDTAHDSLADCRATLYCYQKMLKE